MVFFFFSPTFHPQPKKSTVRLTGNSESPSVAQADDTSRLCSCLLGETEPRWLQNVEIDQHKLALLAFSNDFSWPFCFPVSKVTDLTCN